MEAEIPLVRRRRAAVRLCNVKSCPTELLEIPAEDPSIVVLFIPGNPGIVGFYRDFIEEVYEQLNGSASVTAVGHICHSRKSWMQGRMWTLEDQINHKVDFIKQELHNATIPVVLVGHSIGSYICLEVLKRFPQQVKFNIGLYPFLTLNNDSVKQSIIGKITASPFFSAAISSSAALLGLFPKWASSSLVKSSVGKSWSSTAIDATCNDLLQYHTVRNALYMAMTEFKKLSEDPDWMFIRGKGDMIAFLFGIDDHWGPLSLFEKISTRVPEISLSIEREGHTHAFCCTNAGSVWVASHVVRLIKHRIKM
ncbi:hypothetical protein QJS10_CPB13g01372 [Acorus calamus]|uniref:Lipid droplet-associated hydrolase n=1 Tax=Acorus calamus TaxID=4465 RepID=A0AAV9DEX2_ACOCL|nr:hypothetical protein QJS10_CPB13g01372 [Acorus calamus]